MTLCSAKSHLNSHVNTLMLSPCKLIMLVFSDVFCCNHMPNQIPLCLYRVHFQMWNCLSLVVASTAILLLSGLVQETLLEEILTVSLDGVYYRFFYLV